MALTQDCIESFVAALDSIGLRLTDMEGLRDFPVEEELGRLTLLCLKQCEACQVSCLSTVQAGP